MSLELGRHLLASGAINCAQLQSALFACLSRSVTLVRALIDQGAITPQALEQELSRADIPAIRSVAPLAHLAATLPPAMCCSLLAVPIRVDPVTATVDVAVVDPLDPHVQAEFAFHLNAPVRLVRAPLAAVEKAIGLLNVRWVESANGERTTFPFGEPRGVARTPRPTPLHGSQIPGVAPRAASDPPMAIPLLRRSQTPRAPEMLDDRDVVALTGMDFDDLPDEPVQLSRLKGSPESRPGPREAPTVRQPAVRPKSAFEAHAHAPEPPNGSSPAARVPTFPGAAAPVGPFRRDPQQALDALQQAETRDEVVQCLIEGMQGVAVGVGVLALRKGSFAGWACNPELADPDAFFGLRVPSQRASALSVAADQGWFLGPLNAFPADRRLLDILRSPGHEVCVTAVKVAERAVMLVLATELSDTLTATRIAGTLASAASRALTEIIKSEKHGR